MYFQICCMSSKKGKKAYVSTQLVEGSEYEICIKVSNKGAWGSNLDQIWPKIDQTQPEKVKTGQIGQARPLFQPFEGTEHEICIKTSKNGTWMLDLDQNRPQN